MSFNDLLEEYHKTAATAAKDLMAIPLSTRSAWGASIAEAKQKLKALKTQLRVDLLKNGVAIFLDGEGAVALAKMIRQEGEGVVADAGALYKRLTDALEPTFSPQRNWGVQQTIRLHSALMEVMHDLELVEMSMPDRTAMPVLPTRDAVEAHIRSVIRNAVGGLLETAYIADQVLREVTEIRYTGNVVPVAILNAKNEDRLGLSKVFGKGNASVTVKAEDQVDRDYMLKSFKEINKRIRKK